MDYNIKQSIITSQVVNKNRSEISLGELQDIDFSDLQIQDYIFKDKGYEITLNPNITYFLSFDITFDKNRSFDISLSQKNSLSTEYQLVKTISSNVGHHDIIFTPYESYNILQFVLKKSAMDFNEINTLQLSNVHLYQLTNLLVGNSQIVTNLGFQARPGTLFSINGAEMRVGGSGVYELHYNDILVQSFYVPTPPSDTDQYILDYKYRKENNS